MLAGTVYPTNAVRGVEVMAKYAIIVLCAFPYVILNAQDTDKDAIREELEAKAMTFFQVAIGEKDAESLSDIARILYGSGIKATVQND